MLFNNISLQNRIYGAEQNYQKINIKNFFFFNLII